MILDFHTHISPPWIRDNRTNYLRRDPCFAELYSSPKAKLITAEELIASMDQNSIDVSVALNIGWTSHELCLETNNYILEAVSRYPHRLVGFCTIQPKVGEAAIAEIERCAKEGIKGIGEMRPDIQGFDLGDEGLLAPIVETAKKYHLVFLTHASEPVGHRYAGKGDVIPDMLYRFLSQFPGVPFVGAHWGGGLPFYALMPEVASALTDAFFDTAASPFLYRPQIFKHVVELIGADKILFGSDYPLISPGRLIEEINDLDLSQEIKTMILGGNAERLLLWKGSDPSSLSSYPRK